MSERFPASVLSPTPVVPTLNSAPGVWTMEQQYQARAQTNWPLNPGAVDPNFPSVSVLLHGDGTNGAQNNTFLNTPPPGVGPYAGNFNGSNAYLSIANNSNLDFGTGDFTIEFWLYAVNMPNVAGIVGKKTGDASNGWQVYHNAENANGKMSIRLTLQIDFASTSNWTLNLWEHWAVTRSGSTLRWFKNGVLDRTGSSSANLTDTANTLIGYSQTWGGYFTGYISNLRIVKGTALYTNTFTPSTTPLTAVSGTSLLTFQNATFIDNSSYAQAITVNGGAAVAGSGVVPAITRNGNTTQGSFSPFGTLWSNYFDGSGDYLSGSGSTAFTFGTGAFTVEYWVNQNASTGTYAQHCGCSTTSNGFSFGVNGLTVYMTSNTIGYTGSASITPGTWNHIAWTRDGSNMVRCFLNGVLAYGPTSITTNLTETGFGIGATASGTFAMPGHLSNVRVIKGSALYTSNFTPPASPLTAVSGTSLLTCQSNRFIDNSANAATITRGGDVAVSRFSPFAPVAFYDTSVIGGSAYFDGNGDYLSTPDSAVLQFGTGNFTVELWVHQPAQSGVHNTVVGKWLSGFGTTGDWALRTRFNNSTQFAITLKNTSGWYDITTSTNVSDSAWHHLAFVRDSSTTLKLYVDGVLKATQTISSSDIVGSSAVMSIGGNVNSATNEVASTGFVSNVRIVKGSALYTANFTPPTAPLAAITNTPLLLSMTNGAIFDNAMQCDFETVGNAQISTSVKKYGTGSLAFDGTGDYLSTPANPIFAFGTGDFTVEAWVYPTTIAADWFICSGIGSGGFFFGNSAGVGFGWGRNAVAWDYRSGSLSINTWSHVAVSRSGTTMRLFINGTLQGTAQTNSTLYDLSTGGTSIGSQGTNYYLNGYIDDLRITKGVARYTGNFTPPVAAFSNQ